MCKERFPTKRKSKFHPRGNVPFKVLEQIEDDGYKLDLRAVSNVVNLSLLDVRSNSRMNSF